MRKFLSCLLPALALFGLFASANAQLSSRFGGFAKKPSIEVFTDVQTIEPGASFYAALRLTHGKGLHSYFINPGIVGEPMKVDWTLPAGFTASEVIFPAPHTSSYESLGTTYTSYGYEGVETFLVQLTAPTDLASGQTLEFRGAVTWQECDENGCQPKDQAIKFSIASGAKSAPSDADTLAVVAEAKGKIPAASEDIISSANETDNNIRLTIESTNAADISAIYFYSTDRQIDSQAAQDFATEGGKVILTVKRNRGDEGRFIQPGPVLDTLSGVLTIKAKDGTETSYAVTTPLSGEAATETTATVQRSAAFIPATEEEKAAGLEVWDPEARPAYVLLGGAEETSISFGKGILFVFIGGLLLNLMPCVFPVLGIKIMGFVAQAGEDPKKIKIHGLTFGAGLLIAMWILAAIIISLDLSWGEQLGNPIFLASIIILLFVLGLNLYGLFEFGTSMTSVGGELQGKKGYSGSFFSGVLTTLIATPCSGPFLGVVMGYALSQDNKAIQFAIFTVFGLGIAFPYVVLAFFPNLIKKLPQPGPWMESFKQLMSFAMFATVVFFMKSYLKIVGDSAFNTFLYALVAIALAAYIYGRWGSPYKAKGERIVKGYVVGGLFAVLGFTLAVNTAKTDIENTTTAAKVGDLSWHEWYPGKMELSRSKKRIVWMDFTADW